MYEKSVLWSYNDSNFLIYGVWQKDGIINITSIDNFKVPFQRAKWHFAMALNKVKQLMSNPHQLLFY